jgi:uncharacterized protein
MDPVGAFWHAGSECFHVVNRAILVLGASARAAAHSALRAGLRPVAGDLFADQDLAAQCPAHLVERQLYPHNLETLALALPACPWFYTGALENHPDLIDRLARTRPLWGNDGSTVRAVRDPIRVFETLRRADLPCPTVKLDPRGLPRDGSWLRKPLASAGGRGIEPLVTPCAPARRACYYQERIEGQELSALVLGQRSTATLLGVTWQWIGVPGAPFSYRGSIGPWPLSPQERERIERLARALAAEFRLVGLFGIDLILRDGQPWPVEINPRYTASVEVLELALGRAFLCDHRNACDPDLAPIEPEHGEARPGVVGKAILFAQQPCIFPDSCARKPEVPDWFKLPVLGDIPQPGTHFEPDEPVLTVFAHADSIAACHAELKRLLSIWQTRLGTRE